MTRVKGGVRAHKQREKILRYTKGFRWRRKTNKKAAQEALVHACSHAFHGRKERKRNFRSVWQVKIGAVASANGVSYSKLIHALKKANVLLNRKMLAELAEHEPKVFEVVMAKAK